MIFDSVRGVYVVVGVADCYYHEGHFYRLHGDIWQISVRADNDWRPVAMKSLPRGLQAKAKTKARAKGLAKGKSRL